jgi:hypothetical protein
MLPQPEGYSTQSPVFLREPIGHLARKLEQPPNPSATSGHLAQGLLHLTRPQITRAA